MPGHWGHQGGGAPMCTCTHAAAHMDYKALGRPAARLLGAGGGGPGKPEDGCLALAATSGMGSMATLWGSCVRLFVGSSDPLQADSLCHRWLRACRSSRRRYGGCTRRSTSPSRRLFEATNRCRPGRLLGPPPQRLRAGRQPQALLAPRRCCCRPTNSSSLVTMTITMTTTNRSCNDAFGMGTMDAGPVGDIMCSPCVSLCAGGMWDMRHAQRSVSWVGLTLLRARCSGLPPPGWIIASVCILAADGPRVRC